MLRKFISEVFSQKNLHIIFDACYSGCSVFNLANTIYKADKFIHWHQEGYVHMDIKVSDSHVRSLLVSDNGQKSYGSMMGDAFLHSFEEEYGKNKRLLVSDSEKFWDKVVEKTMYHYQPAAEDRTGAHLAIKKGERYKESNKEQRQRSEARGRYYKNRSSEHK